MIKKLLLVLFLAFLVTSCVTIDPAKSNLKQCAQWICDGQAWPGDYTNCTCRGSEL
jgi:PBP1b-binding outer membrane lipoprotein LpoB